LVTLASLLHSHSTALAVLLGLIAVCIDAILWDEFGKAVATYAIVPLLVLAVGVPWRTGAFQHSTIRPQPTPLPTIKTVFVPPTGEGYVGDVAIVREFSDGVCRSSAVDPNRRSALACRVRGRKRALDPCFPEHSFGGVACFLAPWQTPPWQKAGSLAEAATIAPVANVGKWKPVGAWRRPWALELRGGVQCLRLSSPPYQPAPVEAFYECGRKVLTGWVVGGFPNEKTPTWTVSYVPIEDHTASASIEDVVRVWE